jgi:hypothetical protein
VSAEIVSFQRETYGPALTVMKEEILRAIAAAGDVALPVVVKNRNHAPFRRSIHDDQHGSGVIMDSGRILSRNQSARNIGQSRA